MARMVGGVGNLIWADLCILNSHFNFTTSSNFLFDLELVEAGSPTIVPHDSFFFAGFYGFLPVFHACVCAQL